MDSVIAAINNRVDSLIAECGSMTNATELGKASSLFGEFKYLIDSIEGKQNLLYVKSTYHQARTAYLSGNLNDSESCYLEIIPIQKELIGDAHTDFANTLYGLGVLYGTKGRYSEARDIFTKVKEIRSKEVGENHPDYIKVLGALAHVYLVLGDYDVADILQDSINQKSRVILGESHVVYVQGLSRHAKILHMKGNYEKSLLFFKEALGIYKKIRGISSLEYAFCLGNLGWLYTDIGDYDKAETAYSHVTEVLKSLMGDTAPDYLSSLHNLANVYYHKGDYDRAETINLEVLRKREKVIGRMHQDYAKSLGNLALINYKKGNYERARYYAFDERNIIEELLGSQHPDYAEATEFMAILLEMNSLTIDTAEVLYLQALDIREAVFGKKHPKYASTLHNLGKLYMKKQRFQLAETMFNSAASIFENQELQGSQEYLTVLSSLAQMYWELHNYDETATLLFKCNSVLSKLVQSTAAYSSEREMLLFNDKLKGTMDQSLSFSLTFYSDSLIGSIHNQRLEQNKMLLDAAIKRDASMVNADSMTQSLYFEWKSTLYQLNKLEELPFSNRDSTMIEKLREKAEILEKDIIRRYPFFVKRRREIAWQDIRSSLNFNEAAIEFTRFDYYAPSPTDTVFYAALVLLPGAASPAFIPLCEERELTGLLDSSGTSTFYAGLYRGETKFVPLHTDKAQGKALYDLIWQPLEELLQGTKTIHYAPSGLLHRLNLAAIKTPSDSLLGERHHLITLGSTRQLVPEATIRPETYGQEIALFGGIHFEADMSLTPPPIDSTDLFAGVLRETAAIDSTQRQSTWRYLEGTAREVQNIHDTLAHKGLPVRLHTGHGATEEALKQLGEAGQLSPRVLHLATHGFFSPDPTAVSRNMDGEPVFKWSDNPMMRSGLVLAGGNHAWQHGRPLHPGMEDGILTAQDITQMNLRNTELVVLSACETGLGDIEGNEGVYGLQRAFKIAGAQYLIMSLWKVPDEETAEFMEAFYGHWLSADGKKVSIPDAFRMTQEGMREKYRMEPRKWAGFVLLE